jgi:hypothetical protein
MTEGSRAMKAQDELRADLQRFLAADMLDEAEAVLDLIEPATDEEFQRMLDEAPLDDEPLTEKERSRLEEAAAWRERRPMNATGPKRPRAVLYDGAMKTQDELRADFRRFFDADMLDEAEAVLDLIEPLPFEELKRILDEAPIDDEPLTEKERTRLATAERRLGRTDAVQHVG